MKGLRDIRVKKGYSQCKLAELIGVKQESISQWESGKSMPAGDKLPKLASVLNCTIDALYGDTLKAEV